MTETNFRINAKIYDPLHTGRFRYNYLQGGASSGKSHTMAQFLIKDRLLSEDRYGILIVRKTRPAVKASCWELVQHYLEILQADAGLSSPLCKENKADLILRRPNGNFMKFIGLDNPLKARSMEGINQIWIEEVAAVGADAAFTAKEITQLDLICRAGGLHQMYFSFNPVDPVGNEWLKNLCDNANTKPNSQAIKVTHTDNPFLDEASHKVIEELQETDAEYDKIYRLNEWATPTALIYDGNWDIVPDMPEKYTQRIWGLDFGYSIDPAALTEIRFVDSREVYIREHIYRTHLTNPELIQLMKTIVPMHDRLVADSAEPKSIQEIRNAGFNIFGAIKGPDSVPHGIRTLQSVKQHITVDSTNLSKEIRGYKWIVDIAGEVKSPRKPMKINDHCMDGNRYAITKVLGLVKAGLQMATDDEKPKEHNLMSEDEGWVGCDD